jgi:steroid delta-isomerase-like uncharacterized protein
MTRTEIEAFLERHIAAGQHHDVEALAANHAPDGVIVSPMFTTVRGRAAITDSYRRLFRTFPDWKMTQDDLLIEAPRAALFETASATHENEFFGVPATHRHIEITVVRHFVLENGVITRERRIYDFTGMLVQIGVLRARPAN